jgi:hypothetical protein
MLKINWYSQIFHCETLLKKIISDSSFVIYFNNLPFDT